MSIVGGVDVSDESTTVGRGRRNVIASVLGERGQILLIVGGVVGFCKSKHEWLHEGESGNSVQTVIDGQCFGVTALVGLRRGVGVAFID